MTTILVIDDSASVRRAISLLLTTAGIADRVVEAHDGLAGLKVLLADHPDLVICDLEMPLCDGERFLTLKRTRPDQAHVPVVVLTLDQDPERKAALFDAGAVDYVTKPFHPAELVARVHSHLRLAQLRTELAEKNRHLAELSVTDPLTGLRNRRAFDAALEIEVTRSVRYDVPLSLALLDLDHFKRINDEHGHPAGDEVLAGVGAIVRQCVRSCDVAARYGGEELVVILPHTGLSSALSLGERLRSAIARAVFTKKGGVRVTASIGVAQLVELEHPTAAELVASADAGVYAAKAAGRDAVKHACRPRTGVVARELPTQRIRLAGAR